MESAAALPFQELKRQALTRRVGKLIEWLHRPDYSVYAGSESSTQLVKLINLTIWALERSMPPKEWEHFRQLFLDIRYILVDAFENETQEEANYYIAIAEMEAALKEYAQYISENDIEVVYSE